MFRLTHRNSYHGLTCLDTLIQDGGIPSKFDAEGNVLERVPKREVREFDGRTYLMEKALHGDVAIVRAWKADKAGNCVFRCVFAAI